MLNVELNAVQRRKLQQEAEHNPDRIFELEELQHFLHSTADMPAAGVSPAHKGHPAVAPLPLGGTFLTHGITGAVGLPATVRQTDKQKVDVAAQRLAASRAQSVEDLAKSFCKAWDKTYVAFFPHIF